MIPSRDEINRILNRFMDVDLDQHEADAYNILVEEIEGLLSLEREARLLVSLAYKVLKAKETSQSSP